MRRASALAFAMAGLVYGSPGTAAAQATAVATIEVMGTANGVRISGRALALSAGRFDAELRIEKDGRAGRTATTQGGSVTLEAGRSADIATVGLSLAPGSRRNWC